jgi:hypothetical protein
MKIDYRIALNRIYNNWLSPNDNNEINMPWVGSNNHKSIKAQCQTEY